MDYLSVNKQLWNTRTPVHFQSKFYDIEKFVAGATSLNSIELDLLGDVSGKRILHLQCHFGQDSLALARMGAKVTGVDFSDEAIAKARELAETIQAGANFICCDIFDLPGLLSEKFDIVFTSYGVIGWFPDLDRWSKLIAQFLEKNGRLVFVEFHPVIWMFDGKFQSIEYSYFKDDPIVEKEEGTYADPHAPIATTSITWNHSIGEVISGLLNTGLRIETFEEFNFSPYNIFANGVEVLPGKFQVQGFENKLPIVYSLTARKD
jgi:SAM-dependent methyltransferase